MITRRRFLSLAPATLLLAACSPGPSPAPVVTATSFAPVTPAPSGVAQPAPSAGAAVPASSPSPATAAQGPLDHLSIVYPSVSLSWFPLYVAQQEGFLADEGLSADLTSMTASVQMAALVSGEVDYSTAIGSAISAGAQGLPIITLMAIAARPQHVLEARADIHSVEDLKGQPVGVSSLGSTSQREIQIVLEKYGLSDSDVTFISLENSPGQAAGLISGRVAATSLDVPTNLAVEQQGTHPLVNIADLLDAPLAGLSTSKARVAAHPDEAVHLIRAAQRGIQFAKTNREDTVRLIAEFSSIDADTASAAYDLVRDTWSDDGVVTDEAIRNTFADQQQAASANVDSIVDWSLARQAAGELP